MTTILVAGERMRVCPLNNLLGKLKNKTQIYLFLNHLFGLFEGVAFTLASDRNLFLFE